MATELAQLNRQRDDFIASVSHELRTPVTSIRGFSEQLTEQEFDTDSAQAGRIIYRNPRRLADVIEDVLELSRLTNAEGITRRPVEVDVRTLLRVCANLLSNAAVLWVPPGRAPITSPTAALDQVDGA